MRGLRKPRGCKAACWPSFCCHAADVGIYAMLQVALQGDGSPQFLLGFQLGLGPGSSQAMMAHHTA